MYIYGTVTTVCAVATAKSLVTKSNLVDNFTYYAYFFSLHVSGDHVPNIRGKHCIYTIFGTCCSVWMTVRYAGCNETKLYKTNAALWYNKTCRLKQLTPNYICIKIISFHPAYQTVIHTQ